MITQDAPGRTPYFQDPAVMAVAVLNDRIRNLPSADQDDLLELVTAYVSTQSGR